MDVHSILLGGLILLMLSTAIINYLNASAATRQRELEELRKLYIRTGEREREAKRRLEEKAEKRRLYLEHQKHCQTQLSHLANTAFTELESLPVHLTEAESLLDQAILDFEEGVFGPFWDSITNAAISLARYHEALQHIQECSVEYAELVPSYDEEPPRYPLTGLSHKSLTACTHTAQKMNLLVRNAQKNFEFASIYEQRKTQQILIAGFTNLDSTLKQMSSQITTALGDLSSSVKAVAKSVDTLTTSVEATKKTVSEMSASMKKRAAAEAKRDQRVLHMLDNIQRNRLPFP